MSWTNLITHGCLGDTLKLGFLEVPRIKLANTIPIPIPGPNKASVQYPAPKYLKLVIFMATLMLALQYLKTNGFKPFTYTYQEYALN